MTDEKFYGVAVRELPGDGKPAGELTALLSWHGPYDEDTAATRRGELERDLRSDVVVTVEQWQ